MPGFYVEHFGCRAARADGEALSARLRAAGLEETEPQTADLVVVNTCSVTAEADRSARAFIRRAHRLNPEARLIVTGCYAQRAPRELASMEGVRAVIGNSHKALAPQIALGLVEASVAKSTSSLVQIQSVPNVWADDQFAHSFFDDTQAPDGPQTRPNLKIQEGCSNRCTFCVIPQTRGPSKSLPAESVLRQVEAFVAEGGRELVLSGINLGRWGRDFSGPGRESLAQLVRRILKCTPLERLRLSSIEPMDWDEELICLMREYGGMRLCRHAHLPLQSGSDSVLRRMHRRYRPWHYAAKVQALIAAAGGDLTIGADVMAGFPGETEAEFEQSIDFLRSLPFGYLHLFPFSPRPETPGWTLHAANPIPAALVAERMARLRSLAAEKTRAHRLRFLGRTLRAITLHTPAASAAQGRTAALTENFLPIEIAGAFVSNRLLQARVTGFDAEGTLLAEENSQPIDSTERSQWYTQGAFPRLC